VDLISVEDPAGALEALRYARDALAVREAICEIDAGSGRAGLLRDAGFSRWLARVRVSADPAALRAPATDAAVFRPARELPRQTLIELFRAVSDGSLDQDMIDQRRELGQIEEARQRLEQALSFPGDPEWFSVLVGDLGEPIGYVVPAVIDEMAVIAELGVAQPHREQGHGLELLSHAARILAAADAELVVADTDQANTAMRSTFARAGFSESRPRDTYRYVREGT
jgi:ribosomal protein S18 acetylase RimI-like enzyme